MRLTTSSEYALLALLYIARHSGDGYIPLSRIAEDQKLPFKYLEHLMHMLRCAGILSGMKGQNGGYRLAVPSDKISLAKIIRLFDGPLAPVESASVHFYKPTIIEKEKKLSGIMKDIRNYIADKLENITLKDLV